MFRPGQPTFFIDDVTGLLGYRNAAANRDVPVPDPTNGAGSAPVAAIYHVTATLSPALVAANTTAEQIFAVAGVQVGDVITVNKPSAQAGLGIVGARVSSAGNVGITFSNNTAAGITPTAAEVYQIAGVR